MKLVTSVIKSFKLRYVGNVLGKVGAMGMMIMEVKEYGRQKVDAALYWRAEYIS